MAAFNHRRAEISAGQDRLSSMVSTEDSLALCQRVDLLDRLWGEVTEQIEARLRLISGRLEQWSDFDDRCSRLLGAIAKTEAAVIGQNDRPIEDIIELLKTVGTRRCLILK